MDFATLSTQTLVVLFAIAVIAGFCDTLAGGGGLLVLPALIAGGLPPLLALGTSKLQATAGTAMATTMVLAHGKIAFSRIAWLMLLSCIGATLGAGVVQHIDQSALEFIIPLALLLLIVYFVTSPSAKFSPQKPVWMAAIYKRIAVPSIGFYDGFLGPGTGSFFVFAGVALAGQQVVEATMQAKTLNFASNMASTLLFLAVGQVLLPLAMVMIVGQLIGAYVGSRCLFSINPKYLRILMVCMSVLMLGKYAWSQIASIAK